MTAAPLPAPFERVRNAIAREPLRIDAPDRAAVAVILRPPATAAGDGVLDLDILFIERARDPRDPWSGHMAFPGGRISAEDPDERATAVRETREEVGIDLAAGAFPLGRLDDLQAMARGERLPLVVSPFVFGAATDLSPVAGPEVREALWIPVFRLADPAGRGTLAYAWQGTTLDLPCIRHAGKTIWGLTFRMLEDFLSRLAATP